MSAKPVYTREERLALASVWLQFAATLLIQWRSRRREGRSISALRMSRRDVAANVEAAVARTLIKAAVAHFLAAGTTERDLLEQLSNRLRRREPG